MTRWKIYQLGSFPRERYQNSANHVSVEGAQTLKVTLKTTVLNGSCRGSRALIGSDHRVLLRDGQGISKMSQQEESGSILGRVWYLL